MHWMHPCQFAYAFLVASSMLFIGIKKIKAKEEKKGSPSLWKKEKKVWLLAEHFWLHEHSKQKNQRTLQFSCKQDYYGSKIEFFEISHRNT